MQKNKSCKKFEIIKKEINELTENIDIIYAQRKACDRIVDRYAQIKEDYKKEITVKNISRKLVKNITKNKNR